ncbi:hypothetical protein D3C87_79810 [compost metagenome]
MLNLFPFSMWYTILIVMPFYLLYQVFYVPFLFLKSIKLEKFAYIYWYLPRIFFMDFEQFLLGPKDYFKNFKSRWIGYKSSGLLKLRGVKTK